MSYGMGTIPPVEPIPDPWYQRKAVELQRIAARSSGLSDTPPESYEAPPPGRLNVGLILGWGFVLAAGAGIFYAATTGLGTGRRRVAANRRRSSRRRSTKRNRRSSRRRSTRRNSKRAYPKRRRQPRPYNALSLAARKRMPASSFALSGKRFPIKGPPGSSRERDKAQAQRAITFLTMGRVGSKADYLAVRSAIIREYGANFWKRFDGPSWPKVEKAKRARTRTRRKSSRRSSRRKVAANRRRSSRRPRRNSRKRLPAWMNKAIFWGRDGNRYYVQAPNHKVRFYRGVGGKARAEGDARSLADRYGLPKRKDDGRIRRLYALKRNGKKGHKAGRRTTRNKELQKLMTAARKQGWRIEHSGAGHLKWYPKDTSKPMVVSGSTPSDNRAVKNLKARLRRSGLKA